MRIHINRKEYESPDPTSGEALYALGEIPEHEKLYREVDGEKEDKPVPRDKEHVYLKQDEHFYSQEVFKIFVNTDEHETAEKKISYLEVVELYLGSGGKPSKQYVVKYSHGPAQNPSGTLVPEQKVWVANGMRFRVVGTGES